MQNETDQTAQQTILIVDDEWSICDLLINTIEQETPYRAFAVSDASQAFEAANAIRPCLFILDYGLPGINGIALHDLLHVIKGLEHVPTLMISAFTPSLHARYERQITFLKKPYDLDLLLSVITNLLARQQA